MKKVEASDADAVRARRATANRVLTILKAALNHAFTEGHAVSDEAWRKVKPFRQADAPVVEIPDGVSVQTARQCVRQGLPRACARRAAHGLPVWRAGPHDDIRVHRRCTER